MSTLTSMISSTNLFLEVVDRKSNTCKTHMMRTWDKEPEGEILLTQRRRFCSGLGSTNCQVRHINGGFALLDLSNLMSLICLGFPALLHTSADCIAPKRVTF